MKNILSLTLISLLLSLGALASDNIPKSAKICSVYFWDQTTISFSCDGSPQADLEKMDRGYYVDRETSGQLFKFMNLGYKFQSCHSAKLAGDPNDCMVCILTK